MINKDIVIDVIVLRLAHDEHFRAKHGGFIIRAKTRALRQERTKVTRWAPDGRGTKVLCVLSQKNLSRK